MRIILIIIWIHIVDNIIIKANITYMKLTSLAVIVALFGVVFSNVFNPEVRREVKKTHFGGLEITDHSEEGYSK